MDVREKLVELIRDGRYKAEAICNENNDCQSCTISDPVGHCKYGCIADYLIAHGVTVQEWISVKDRLPEVVDIYIVAIKSKAAWEKDYTYDVDVATYNPYEKAYIDDCWNTYVDWDEGQEYIHVTHWMHLPHRRKENE